MKVEPPWRKARVVVVGLCIHFSVYTFS